MEQGRAHTCTMHIFSAHMSEFSLASWDVIGKHRLKDKIYNNLHVQQQSIKSSLGSFWEWSNCAGPMTTKPPPSPVSRGSAALCVYAGSTATLPISETGHWGTLVGLGVGVQLQTAWLRSPQSKPLFGLCGGTFLSIYYSCILGIFSRVSFIY